MYPAPEFKVRVVKLDKYADPKDNDGMRVGDVLDGWEYLPMYNTVSVVTKEGKESALFEGEFEFVTE